MSWITVGNNNELKDGDLFGFDYGDKKLLVAKINDKIFVTDGICTHQYADLSNGFLNEQEKTVTCPLHLSAFNLESGICLNPPAEKPLRTYQVKVDDADKIQVLLD